MYNTIDNVGNNIPSLVQMGHALEQFAADGGGGGSEDVYITDNGNYKIRQFEGLESTVMDQMQKGINNTWQQRNYAKVLSRINNTVALDALRRTPQKRRIHLDQNHFSGNVRYKYRGTVPGGESVNISINGLRVLTINKGNGFWIEGSFNDVENIGIEMSGHAVETNSTGDEVTIRPGFDTRIIGTWYY